jgi:acetylglutamate/LysW-gamma-L-alpha-aminoadipate kinase
LIEAPGFLDNPDDESSLVKRMTVAELNAREAVVEGRIKRKLLALTRLCSGGNTRVIISDGRGEHPVEDALNGGGTHIQ